MSQNSVPATKQEEKQGSGGGGSRKTAATSSTRPQEQQEQQQQQQQQALRCPRCDSANTKFCYYNNYSLTQPRHFCKSCRRYWTKGGALRNVPIGGGCRKNKKIKSSSSSRLSGDSKDSSSGSLEMGGFNFFRGLSPAMDFDLGGLSFPRINPSTSGLYNQFSSFGGVAAATSPAAAASVNSPYCFSLDPSGTSAGSMMGFSYPISSVTSGFSGAIQEVGAASMNVHSSLASSIESLSSINQDLHLKLQQQRLAMLFGEEHQKESTAVSSVPLGIQPQKPQPILFQNLEISRPEAAAAPPGVGNSRKAGASGGGDATAAATEWFFGNSYGEVTAMTPTPTNSSSNGNNDHNTGNWTGVQAWGDLHHHHHHQYNALP